MKKKFMSVLLVFGMLLSIFPGQILAHEPCVEIPEMSHEEYSVYENANTWNDYTENEYADLNSYSILEGDLSFDVQQITDRYTVLVLDVSGSMNGVPINSLKIASKRFVNLS